MNTQASFKCLLGTTAAITLAVGLSAGGAQAQEGQAQETQAPAGQQQPAPAQDNAAASPQQGDRLVATVGETEIRQSDVMDAIEALPPQIQQMPLQMLFPNVVQQLVLRELMLEEARAEDLDEDPEVRALVEQEMEAVEDQALVQVWLQRELDERVTGSDIEEAYGEIQAENPDIQPLEDLRPQIQQALQQQAVAEIGAELGEAADVTFYDVSGEPLDASELQADGSSASNPGGQGTAGAAQSAAPERDSTEAPDEQQAGVTLSAAQSDEYGEYLTDADGRAVYLFTADDQGQGDAEQAVSNCHDACADAWPPVLTSAEVSAEGTNSV